MAKNSGIRALKNIKNKIAQKNPPVKTQRVVVTKKSDDDAGLSDSAGQRAIKPEPSGGCCEYLEESPAPGLSGTQEKKPVHQHTADSKPVSFRATRSGRRSPGLPARFFNKLVSVLDNKKKTGKAGDALAFASSNKRLGKKGRRNRMIWLYAGTGVVVVAVLLVVFVAPGGNAAPAEAGATSPGSKSAMNGQQNSAYESAVTSAEHMESVIPSAAVVPTAVPTATPHVTITPTVEPTLPAEIPTTEPTEEATPVVTTKPEPTPPPVNMNELVRYFVVDAKSYYNEMGYSSNQYKYTNDEYYMLAQIIDIEARGESFEGKVAVGNVVMNRVLCRSFPGSTITEVITRPGQFAYAGRENRKPASSSKRAARAVLDDELWVVAQDVYYFRSGVEAGVNWGSHKFYKKIGGHCFYTHSYSGRHRGGDAPPALFNRTFKYAQYGCKPENRVYRIQYMLNKLGYSVKADKYFGVGTKVELMKFQQKKGLEADGVAGPATIKALIKAYGVDKYYNKFIK